MSRDGMKREQESALIDAQAICREYGHEISVMIREPGEVQRDPYGPANQRDIVTELTVYAWPVETNPTERRLEKLGLREAVDYAITMPRKTFDDAGVDPSLLDFDRTTVVFEAAEWEIVDKGSSSRFANTDLYVVWGVNRS